MRPKFPSNQLDLLKPKGTAMYYKTIDQIKEQNIRGGYTFFSESDLSFFASHIEPKVYAGKFFLTSEKIGDYQRRGWTIRECLPSGKIKNASQFQQYATLLEAEAAVRELACQE